MTSEAPRKTFSKTKGFHEESVREEMKSAMKNGKSKSNGVPFTRRELLAAHQRALKRTEKMTACEGFQSLVSAGIITAAGKLSPRYGG